MEKSATCKAARFDATRYALSVHFLTATTVDVQQLQHGCEVPDMVERDQGELAAPFGSDTDSTEQRG